MDFGGNMSKKQYAVIGVGRFGYALALELEKSGYEVFAVDKNMARIDDISSHVTHAVQADPSDENDFKTLGLNTFDAVVVAIGHNLPASIMICMLAKESGVPYVLVKASEPIHGKILERIGADAVVYPEHDMGIRVAHRLISSNVLDFIELSDTYDMSNIRIPSDWVGKTIADLNIRSEYGLTIVAIRANEEVIVTPPVDRAFQKNDVVIVIGPSKQLIKFESTIS